MLNYFLLFSFLVSFIPLAYILGDMNPSNSCGPFKASSEEHFYTGLVYGLISVSKTWRPCCLSGFRALSESLAVGALHLIVRK